jgi:hypothetical protein
MGTLLRVAVDVKMSARWIIEDERSAAERHFKVSTHDLLFSPRHSPSLFYAACGSF